MQPTLEKQHQNNTIAVNSASEYCRGCLMSFSGERKTDGGERPFLFFFSNGNQARIAAFVANILQQKGHRTVFVGTDKYYNQNAELVLKALPYEWEELGCCSSVHNWWAIDETAKLPFIENAISSITELFLRQLPCCLVVANSLGELEQHAIRIAERFGVPTVQFQDGIMDAPVLPWSEQQVHAASVFDGGCELFCAWSDTVRDSMIARGLSSRVITVGNPRYDKIASWPGYKTKGGPFQVLVTGQCFAKYGTLWPSAELSLYEHIIGMLLTRQDIHVLFKPHPQSNVFESYRDLPKRFSSRVELIEHGDILDQLRDVDLLLTIASTTAVESTLMGIPSALLWYLYSKEPAELLAGDRKFLEDLHRPEFPVCFYNWDRDMEKWATRFAQKPDGKASERMAEEIIAVAERARKVKELSTTPESSVVIDLLESDPLSTVQSVLRQNGNFEVLAIDRTPDGRIAKELSQVVSDSRLVLVRKAGAKHGPALNEVLAQCRGKIILRLHGNCVALPSWCERLSSLLKGNNNAAVAISYLGYRNQVGVSQSILTLPPSVSLETLSKDERAAYFALAYGFRKSDLERIEKPIGNEIEHDLLLMSKLVNNPQDARRIAVEGATLFLSPYSYRPLSISAEKRTGDIKTDNPVPGTTVADEQRTLRSNRGATPEISVLLSSYNRAEKVKKCLEAFRTQTLDPSQFEIICVNDGSTDGTGQAMKAGLSHLPGEYFEHDRNRALAAGRNTALKYARGKLVLFINDDTYATPTFLEEHVKAHREINQPLAAVHGYLPFVDQYKQRIFSLALMQGDLYFGFSALQPGKEYPFWYFITGNLSVPRSAFVDNDVRFDETFIRYGYEDIECGYRLWKKGLRVYYRPSAVAIHDHKISIQEYVRREESNSVNILQFIAKHPDPMLTQALLTVPKVTEEVIKEWQEFALNNQARINNLISQIESVEDMFADMSPEKATASLNLVKEVSEATRMIGYFIKYKSFAEALETYPELRDSLMSPAWNQTFVLRGQELGMSV